MGTDQRVTYKQQPEGVFIYLTGLSQNDADTIIQLTTK
jgi:hypothetical protein